MSNTTLVSVVLGILLTLLAGSIVGNAAINCADCISQHSAPLYEALK